MYQAAVLVNFCFLLMTLTQVPAHCPCNQERHPQEMFCSADVVIRGKLFGGRLASELPNSTNQHSMIIYKVKMIKMFQGFDKMHHVSYLQTPAPPGLCYLWPQPERKHYLITGRVQEGRLVVNSCDWVQTWQSLSLTQRRSLRFRYRKGCACQIRKCSAWQCGVSRESDCWWTDWQWQGKARGHQARHYACLRRAGKSCSWYRGQLDPALGKTNDQTQVFP
uniref:metalloproteinase inhibitor 3 n=1 Tax=Myxine glutinosa TaxID=7769 RepID=UPI00358F8524